MRLKSAFRIVLVWCQECELLGMKWKEAYYVDTCLPFGLRSAPYLFNQFVKVLQWILQHNYGLQWLVHYLDDYLIVGAPDSHSCSEHLQCFLRHLQEFLPKWNGTSQLSINNPQMHQTLSYTQTLAHMDVVCTFKESGFTTTGNHISSFPMARTLRNCHCSLHLGPQLVAKACQILL